MLKITDWKSLTLFLFTLLCCIGASEVRAQACIASPPITPAVSQWCIGGECAATVNAAFDLYFQNHVLAHQCPFAQKCTVNGPCLGSVCRWGVPANDGWKCNVPGGITCDADGSSFGGFSATATQQQQCKPGSKPYGEQCLDESVRLDDEMAAARGEQRMRDAKGNLMSVGNVTFSGYDACGRPHSYFDGIMSVGVDWPAEDCGPQPTALHAQGWTIELSWNKCTEQATVVYLPQGDKTHSLVYGDTDHVVSHLYQIHDIFISSQSFDASGNPIGTAAAIEPHHPGDPSAATAQNPFQPRVRVPALPGTPPEVGVLGALTPLLPVFDYLGKQIGLFVTNLTALAAVDDSVGDQCTQLLVADYDRCDKAIMDGYGARPSWTPRALTLKSECDASARERYKHCLGNQADMRGAPELLLPPSPSQVRANCEAAAWAQYVREQRACDKIPPGAQSIMCYDDAYTRWQRNLAACKRGE